VHLFSGIVPTPFVPFTVQQKKSAVGIVITASHNPKEDNGYKVYWNNGAQVIQPSGSIKNIPTQILMVSHVFKKIFRQNIWRKNAISSRM
jgi:phosphomannomutase